MVLTILGQKGNMISKEITLTGSMAITLVNHAEFPETNFFGASFYEGKDDSEDERILSFKDGFIFTEQNKYPFSIFKKELAELIFPEPSKELMGLINSLKSIGEKRQEKVDNHLASIGFPVNLGVFSLEQKEYIWSLVDTATVPSASHRSNFFELAKKTTNLNWCSRFFERWLLAAEKNNEPEPLGRMHLAYVFRQTGLLKQALEVTNVVEFPRERFKCPPHLLSILATMRAAVFLDIFEKCHDKQLLAFSRKTVNKAWAINKSDEASNVYQRLHKFERLIETENYKARIEQAYKDWADWQ